MPSIRIQSSKPSHPGRYSQQRKIQKQRNHNHKYEVRGKHQVCTIPRCKAHFTLQEKCKDV